MPRYYSNKPKNSVFKSFSFFGHCPNTPEAQVLANRVVEEVDETLLWLEMIGETGIAKVDALLLKEVKERLFIMSASRKFAKGRDNQ